MKMSPRGPSHFLMVDQACIRTGIARAKKTLAAAIATDSFFSAFK